MSIQVKCEVCKTVCEKKHIKRSRSAKHLFCSKACKDKFHRITINCLSCDKPVERILAKASGNIFCSRSCSTTYRNLHRKTTIPFLEDVKRAVVSKYRNLKVVQSDIFDVYLKDIGLAYDLRRTVDYFDKLKYCLENKIYYYVVDCEGRGKDEVLYVVGLILENVMNIPG